MIIYNIIIRRKKQNAFYFKKRRSKDRWEIKKKLQLLQRLHHSTYWKSHNVVKIT